MEMYLLMTGTSMPPSAKPLAAIPTTSAILFRNQFPTAATITVHDQDHAVLEGVTVEITWSGCVSGTDSAVTDYQGQVEIDSPSDPVGGTFTCTVTNLTKTDYPYQSTDNHETSDSIQNP